MAIGRPIDLSANVTRKLVSETASGVTTTFTITGGYRINELGVYRNGVRLVQNKDFTANDGSAVSLVDAAADGDTLDFVVFDSFNISNTISPNSSNQTISGNLTVTGATQIQGGISTSNNVGFGTTRPDSIARSDNSVILNAGIITAYQLYGDGTGLTNLSVTGINTTGFSTFKQAAFSGVTTVTDSTASTSTTSGALIVSGGVGIAKSLFVGEGISIAGTITYNDVTNIDSVGIVTAGKGFRATTGGLQVTAGVGTFKGDVQLHGNQGVTSVTFDSSANTLQFQDDSYIKMGTGSDFHLYHDASNSYIVNTTGELRIDPKSGERGITLEADGSVNLYYDNSAKIETISTGASVYGGLRLTGGGLMREALKIDNTALNSGSTINLSDGMIHYRSTAVGGANVKLNVISSAGINTDMAIGDVMTVTVITVAGSTSHFVDQIRIDGVEASAGVTTNWSGGSVPSDGGGSGIDSYSFNIMKTANATYVVLANQTKTS